MCGLIGWDLHSAPSRAMAYTLAWGAEERGMHSWGTLTHSDVTRGLGKLSDVGERLTSLTAVACHTRYATHGKVSIENAHPFTHEHVTLMHNGVISNHTQLNAKHARAYEVDSQHLAAHLAEGRSLRDIRGYGVIVWRERGEEGVFLCRLTESGDIAVARYGDSGVVWSSDDQPIRRAALLDGVALSWYQIRVGTVYHLRAQCLYRTSRRRLEIGQYTPAKRWQDYTTPISDYPEAWDSEDFYTLTHAS